MQQLGQVRALSNAPIEDHGIRIGLMGVPFDNAVSYQGGPRLAPQRIRSLMPRLARITEEGVPLVLPIFDHGDVPPDLDWARYFGAVEEAALNVLKENQLGLFLGGDHSVGIPLFKAFTRRFTGPVGYIQFDAHPDLADEYDGHPWSHACTARRNLEQKNLDHRHLAFVGLRSHMVDELQYYAEHPEIGWHTARDVYRKGIEAVAREVAAQLQGVSAVYMSIDVDGIDPSCTPGTGTPVHGGPSMRECMEFLRIIYAELPVRAMDIVEVSPPLDISDVTSMAAVKLLYEGCGFFQEKSLR
ncbi:arginase family protein [Chondromyces apiculatus]|uniref:Arginase n=1 Tax=Chondromyces apiculatus DSM 436 TaxID=1192034 RepID=A0A017SWU8_9BACT|nr:arginase family protein [Chondromyces apiculatus]EYF01040.1 arginase [Chondromyces apiculatus DSM 436]